MHAVWNCVHAALSRCAWWSARGEGLSRKFSRAVLVKKICVHNREFFLHSFQVSSSCGAVQAHKAVCLLFGDWRVDSKLPWRIAQAARIHCVRANASVSWVQDLLQESQEIKHEIKLNRVGWTGAQWKKVDEIFHHVIFIFTHREQVWAFWTAHVGQHPEQHLRKTLFHRLFLQLIRQQETVMKRNEKNKKNRIFLLLLSNPSFFRESVHDMRHISAETCPKSFWVSTVFALLIQLFASRNVSLFFRNAWDKNNKSNNTKERTCSTMCDKMQAATLEVCHSTAKATRLETFFSLRSKPWSPERRRCSN